MKPDRTTAEVFVDAVRDELNGTPNASHPVQFRDLPYHEGLVGCTLCGSVVADADEWKDQHRENHDKHNRVHDKIEAEALSYKSPPRYG